MSRFKKIYNEIIKPKEYTYNDSKSFNSNEIDLKRRVYLENSSRFLYEKLEGMFGEDYAERLTSDVLRGDLEIVGFDKFPLIEYKTLTDVTLLQPHLHTYPFTMIKSNKDINLVTFYSIVIPEIMSALKSASTIELYDFLICLSVLIDKWRITEYPKYVANKSDSDSLLKQFVKLAIVGMFSKTSDMQNITVSILDRESFDKQVGFIDYTMSANDLKVEPDYIKYLETVKLFLDIVKAGGNNNDYTPPRIKVYTLGSNKIMAEFLEAVAKHTKIHIGVVRDVFKHISYDAKPQDVTSEEFHKGFDELSRMKKTDYTSLYLELKDIFTTDYINYLNVVDRQLSNLLSNGEIYKTIPAFEMVYKKSQYQEATNAFKLCVSEVIVKYDYLSRDCETREDYIENVKRALVDAHTINLIRCSLFSKVFKATKINVKFEGVDEDMISTTYTAAHEQLEVLKSTYDVDMSFEIMQRMYFRDKNRKCYLLV